MNSEEILKKWGDMGLLDGIENPDRKLDLALTYERAAQILVGGESVFGRFDFTITAIFPIIYRVIKAGGRITDVTDLIDKFKQFLEDNMWVIQELHGADFDAELELCSMFAEDYCEWLKYNPEMGPIRYVPKHKL